MELFHTARQLDLQSLTGCCESIPKAALPLADPWSLNDDVPHEHGVPSSPLLQWVSERLLTGIAEVSNGELTGRLPALRQGQEIQRRSARSNEHLYNASQIGRRFWLFQPRTFPTNTFQNGDCPVALPGVCCRQVSLILHVQIDDDQEVLAVALVARDLRSSQFWRVFLELR